MFVYFVRTIQQRSNKFNNSDAISSLAITANGEYLAVTLRRELVIISLKQKNRLVSYQTGGWQLSKCLSFHPSNESLAFGDESGKIHVWNDFKSLFEQRINQSSQKTQENGSCLRSLHEWLTKPDRAMYRKRQNKGNNSNNNNNNKNNIDEDTKMAETNNSGSKKKKGFVSNIHKRVGQESEYLMRHYHWHAHEVKWITFTTDGAYMLSGGEESVLLMTQLETNREFHLPRLGGAIGHIAVSPDEIKFAVCLDSNVVRIVDAVNNKFSVFFECISIGLVCGFLMMGEKKCECNVSEKKRK